MRLQDPKGTEVGEETVGEGVLDKACLIGIRFLAIASFGSTVFASFGPHHVVSIEEHPYVQHLFDIDCQNLHGDSREYCEQSHNTRYYTLWRSFDSFFSLQDWDGGVLCGTREFDLPLGGEIRTLIVESLGKCPDSVNSLVIAFTLLSCFLAALLTISITILPDIILESRHASKFHAGIMVIMVGTMICSAVAVATYLLFMDPLRLDPTFCESQSLFEYCDEFRGTGFWFQVATLIMMVVALIVAMVWRLFGSPPGVPTATNENIQQGESKSCTQQRHEHEPFYASLHFYVNLLKFSELAILICGIVSAFSHVQTTIPKDLDLTATEPNNRHFLDSNNTTTSAGHVFSGNGAHMDTHINLWQGLFCHPFGARLFLWSVVLDELEAEVESFGECEARDLFEVQMGYIMATVTAITSMTFQKDAKTMPLAYLIGFIMHFLSMVKLSWAIGAFMMKVFPGRDAVDPSYCSLWTTYVPGSTCSIEVGVGLILTSAALGTVFFSFIGEVILEQSQEYGVRTAFRTLWGRVREGRVHHLLNATSERVLKTDNLGTAQGLSLVEEVKYIEKADNKHNTKRGNDKTKGEANHSNRWIIVSEKWVRLSPQNEVAL